MISALGLCYVIIVVVVITVGIVNRYHWQKRKRVTMIDGIADDAWVGVKYNGSIIPMRYLEYLTLWKGMTRKEKREMVIKIRKSLDKGKVKRAESVFEEVFEDSDNT